MTDVIVAALVGFFFGSMIGAIIALSIAVIDLNNLKKKLEKINHDSE